MDHLRSLIAGVLGLGLGLFFILAPETVIRIHTVGRIPSDRHGEYGSDSDFDERWVWVIRGVGLLMGLGGVYIAFHSLLLP